MEWSTSSTSGPDGTAEAGEWQALGPLELDAVLGALCSDAVFLRDALQPPKLRFPRAEMRRVIGSVAVRAM